MFLLEWQYYETLLDEAKEKREEYISEAVEKAMALEIQDIQLKIEKIMKEKKVVAYVNFLTFAYFLWTLLLLFMPHWHATLVTCGYCSMIGPLNVPILFSCFQSNEKLVKNQNLWREKIKEIEDRYPIFMFMLLLIVS